MFKVTEKATGIVGVAFKSANGKITAYLGGKQVSQVEKQFTKKFDAVLDENSIPVDPTAEEIQDAFYGVETVPSEPVVDPAPEGWDVVDTSVNADPVVDPAPVADATQDVPAAEPTITAPVPAPAAPESLVQYISGSHVKTATSTKTQLRVKLVKQNVFMEVTEYGAYITDVTVKDVDGKTVYKSKKFSIQDALNELKVQGDDHKNIKGLISAIKKQLKAQTPVAAPAPVILIATPAPVDNVVPLPTADVATDAQPEDAQPEDTQEQIAQ